MSMHLSTTTKGAAATGAQITPLYDRQYMTLHSLLEREMRNRVESEKMIRDDMTQIQEGMARVCNQIQEVAADLKANLPRLFQETKELRRETEQLTVLYQANVNEMTRLTDAIALRNHAVDQRFDTLEQLVQGNQNNAEKTFKQIWEKLCSKAVVQELADKVGCLDMESMAKFRERKDEHDAGMAHVAELEKKVQAALDEFLRGLNKCDFLYNQCATANADFKKAAEKVTAEHREMVDTIVFPRVERCESLLNQEMTERVECLKKVAHELVHSKEQNDKIKDQLERLGIELANAQVAGANLAANRNGDDAISTMSPLDASAQRTPIPPSGPTYASTLTENVNFAAAPQYMVSQNATPSRPVNMMMTPQQPQSVTPGLTPRMLTMPGLAPIRTQQSVSKEADGSMSQAYEPVMIGGKQYPPGTRVLSSVSRPPTIGV